MPILNISNLSQAVEVADTDLLIVETTTGTKAVPKKLLLSPSEEWVFTLEDGSTVTKSVVTVEDTGSSEGGGNGGALDG